MTFARRGDVSQNLWSEVTPGTSWGGQRAPTLRWGLALEVWTGVAAKVWSPDRGLDPGAASEMGRVSGVVRQLWAGKRRSLESRIFVQGPTRPEFPAGRPNG